MGNPTASMGAMPNVPCVEVEPEEVVAVLHDLRDDLAEPERDDREVVAAQAQRRQADDDPGEEREEAGDDQDDPHRDVDPGLGASGTEDRKWNVTWSNCCEANQPAVYAPTA